MTDSDGVACRLEPPSLVEAFVNNPPDEFSAFFVSQKTVETDGAGELSSTPAFCALFDLTTTLDAPVRSAIARFPLLCRLLRLPALFVGSTVSEYSLLPRKTDFQSIAKNLISDMRKNGISLIIVKDIAASSAILDRDANQLARHCLEKLIELDFISVEGQALAYVPIDFGSEDEYLKRFSRSRRKDLRRKLKTRDGLEIKEVRTGDAIFFDEQFLNQFYELYLNVYDQSEIHFDRLSMPFFKQVLQDGNSGGVCFLYLQADRMIGWNLCYVYGNRLVDKYIGLVYPEARSFNLYFVSWFHNLRFAIEHKLDCYVAGWTDREVKDYLGASFTFTKHAVYFANPVLRVVLKPFKRFFESDSNRAGRGRADSTGRSAGHDQTLGNAASRDGGQDR